MTEDDIMGKEYLFETIRNVFLALIVKYSYSWLSSFEKLGIL